jgi:hypothetical protein
MTSNIQLSTVQDEKHDTAIEFFFPSIYHSYSHFYLTIQLFTRSCSIIVGTFAVFVIIQVL